MASSLEKFFQSKVKQMPPVEFVLLAAQRIIENSTGCICFTLLWKNFSRKLVMMETSWKDGIIITNVGVEASAEN